MPKKFLTNINIAGSLTTTSDISAGGVLKSTQSSTNEGGQIELSVPSSGASLNGTNVTIDVYQNKLRIFESGSPNRGAYIPLDSTASSVGTNLLAGTTGAMNYAQTLGTIATVTTGSTFPFIIVSATITTNGYPVHIIATGDANNVTAATWGRMQLYRDTTALGGQVHFESSAANENVPYAVNVIDTPAAGTYTYSLKVGVVSGGTFNFGESSGPVITVVELSGPKGDAGTSGNSFTTISTPSGTSPVADNATDTLTLAAGSGITITGNASTDTITIASTATGGGDASFSDFLLMGG